MFIIFTVEICCICIFTCLVLRVPSLQHLICTRSCQLLQLSSIPDVFWCSMPACSVDTMHIVSCVNISSYLEFQFIASCNTVPASTINKANFECDVR